MSISKESIETFFAEYEKRTNQALTSDPVIDTEATASAFADCFIESSPKGVMCGTNNAEFREQIPKGFEFYRSIGTQSMQIQKIDTTTINEMHSIAKVYWRAHYVKKDSAELNIDFDVIYMVRNESSALKIFCHITGDEEKAYRDNNLVPQETDNGAGFEIDDDDDVL